MRSRSNRQSPGVISARLLLASVFIVMGAYRLFAAYQGAPTSGSTLVFSSVELLLGVVVAGGWGLRWTTIAAAVLLLIDAFLSHKFWPLGGAAHDAQLLHFMKNISIAGGFLLLSLVSGHRPRY